MSRCCFGVFHLKEEPLTQAKQVTVQLMGGLGNQMFQYAAARALASRNGAKLLLDNRSAFITDRVYGRQYELDPMPIRGELASFAYRMPFWWEAKKSRAFRR